MVGTLFKSFPKFSIKCDRDKLYLGKICPKEKFQYCDTCRGANQKFKGREGAAAKKGCCRTGYGPVDPE